MPSILASSATSAPGFSATGNRADQLSDLNQAEVADGTARERASPSVVLILPTYLPESFGGAEQQSRKLGLALSRLGVRVTLLAPRLFAQTPKRERDASISLRRFRVRQPPNLGGRHIGSLIIWTMKLFCWLTLNRKDYDVIHVIHGRLHAVPAVLAGALLRKPTLIKLGRGGIEHFDLDLVSRKRWFGRWYATMLVRYTTSYIANSREIVQDLRRWQIDESRIHEIPNGVELPRLQDGVHQGDVARCIYLGRLDREKSIDMMIHGFARLRAEIRATLTIVGDGDCRRDLEALVENYGIGNRVFFTGSVTDVARQLQSADIFVSTSVSEGMSNALLEAMSFALMPLVSKVSGVADIVEHNQSGVLFAPGSLDAFASALEAAVALPPEARRALGAAARATVEERFGIDQVAATHVKLYEQARTTFDQ